MREIIVKVKLTDGGYSWAGLRTDERQVEITHLKGRMLDVKQVAAALMIWTETYNLVREYAQKPRRFKFDIIEKEKTMGRSTDLKLKVYKFVNNFCVPVIADTMHISEYGKLNQNYAGYIGDLVELFRYYDNKCSKIFSMEFDHNDKEYYLDGVLGIDKINLEYNDAQQCKNGLEKFAI